MLSTGREVSILKWSLTTLEAPAHQCTVGSREKSVRLTWPLKTEELSTLLYSTALLEAILTLFNQLPSLRGKPLCCSLSSSELWLWHFPLFPVLGFQVPPQQRVCWRSNNLNYFYNYSFEMLIFGIFID